MVVIVGLILILTQFRVLFMVAQECNAGSYIVRVLAKTDCSYVDDIFQLKSNILL